MADLRVRLYALPGLEEALAAMDRQGVAVRTAIPPEKPRVRAWVERHFPHWVPEVEVALGRLPVSCLLALRRNFFGPTGVLEAERRRGIGRALRLAALHAQRAQGHAYAVIGAAGPAYGYARTVGAVPIAGSEPGIYAGALPPQHADRDEETREKEGA